MVQTPEGAMVMAVVYESPSDYPGRVVARFFDNGLPTDRCIVANEDNYGWLANTLEYCGFVKIQRHELDDPKIKEVWL